MIAGSSLFTYLSDHDLWVHAVSYMYSLPLTDHIGFTCGLDTRGQGSTYVSCVYKNPRKPT